MGVVGQVCAPYHINICKISRLWGAVSSLVFNKSFSNFAILLILRRSFQWCRRIFPNFSMSKVEEKKNREKVYYGTHFGSSSLLVSQVANDHHLAPCKVIQDVLGILDSIFTRWMPHFIYWIPCQWYLNSGFQSLGKQDSGFLELNNEFHSQGFRILPAKISRFPESRHTLYGVAYQRAQCGLI